MSATSWPKPAARPPRSSILIHSPHAKAGEPWPGWVILLLAFVGTAVVFALVALALYVASGSWTRPVQATPARRAVIEKPAPEPEADAPSALFDPDKMERLLLQPYLKQRDEENR